MTYNGLKSIINEPTRIFKLFKSCIDHVFLRLHNEQLDIHTNESLSNIVIKDSKVLIKINFRALENLLQHEH